MKNLLVIIMLVGFAPALMAKNDKMKRDRKVSNVQTTKIVCVIEDSRSSDVKVEELYSEADILYAPIFGGKLVEGTGGVRPTTNVGDKIYKSTINGDSITVTLKYTDSMMGLTQLKYIETLDAAGASSVQRRAGYCTSYQVR